MTARRTTSVGSLFGAIAVATVAADAASMAEIAIAAIQARRNTLRPDCRRLELILMIKRSLLVELAC